MTKREQIVGLEIAPGVVAKPSCCDEYMEDDGGCSEGCCDDYKCLKCGTRVRVEAPD